MYDLTLQLWVWKQNAETWMWDRLSPDERGEGVISAAIAVLIMAFLGVALWIAFKTTLKGATNNVDQQVTNIGR